MSPFLRRTAPTDGQLQIYFVSAMTEHAASEKKVIRCGRKDVPYSLQFELQKRVRSSGGVLRHIAVHGILK